MGRSIKYCWQAVVLLLFLSGCILSCTREQNLAIEKTPSTELEDIAEVLPATSEAHELAPALPDSTPADPSPEDYPVVFSGFGSIIGSLSSAPKSVAGEGVEHKNDLQASEFEEDLQRTLQALEREESLQQIQRTSREVAARRSRAARQEVGAVAAPAAAKTRGISSRDSVELPIFPWPPPQPSARMKLRRRLYEDTPIFRNPDREPDLGEVTGMLSDILIDAGYWEQVYYGLPDRTGVALVTRLERINADGSPVKGNNRFIGPTMEDGFSLKEILYKLLFEPEGFFRLGVFVLTNRPFVPDDKGTMTSSRAAALLADGMTTLPRSYASLEFSNDFFIEVLIYEFERSGNSEVRQIRPGRLPARMHLQKSSILSLLNHSMPVQ